jgi:hypothetical protein
MEFLQPILLWGLLGLSVPILIHLWNGKKGKLVSWAAMHWLQEQDNQSSKSIRIDQLLLLFLRLMLIVLLVFLLAHLFVKAWDKSEAGAVIHLVQPNQVVISDFKFELEQALEKGEKVILGGSVLTEIESLDDLNQTTLNQYDKIQESLDQLPGNTSKLNLYLSNSNRLISSEFLDSPVKPTLFLSDSPSKNQPGEFLKVGPENYGFVNENGQLAFSDQVSNSGMNQVWEGAQISYYFEGISESEQAYLEASIAAISEVFPIEFDLALSDNESNLIFTNQYPDSIDSAKLYFLINQQAKSRHQNVLILSDSINSAESELVQTGKLPEMILENLILHLGLKRKEMPISQNQLQSRFLISDLEKSDDKGNMSTILLGLMVLTFVAERILSQRRGI